MLDPHSKSFNESNNISPKLLRGGSSAPTVQDALAPGFYSTAISWRDHGMQAQSKESSPEEKTRKSKK